MGVFGLGFFLLDSSLLGSIHRITNVTASNWTTAMPWQLFGVKHFVEHYSHFCIYIVVVVDIAFFLVCCVRVRPTGLAFQLAIWGFPSKSVWFAYASHCRQRFVTKSSSGTYCQVDWRSATWLALIAGQMRFTNKWVSHIPAASGNESESVLVLWNIASHSQSKNMWHF